MCTGTLVHYEQLWANRQGTSGQVKEEDAASVHGYTGNYVVDDQETA